MATGSPRAFPCEASRPPAVGFVSTRDWHRAEGHEQPYRWSLSVRARVLALCVAGLAGCAARAPSRAPVQGVRGPPLIAWLEGEDAALALTVLPVAGARGPIVIEARGAAGRRWTTRGGRVALSGLAARGPLEIEVTWTDPGDVAGARVVLHHPPHRETAPPRTFEPIERVNLGRDGPSVEQAIRIR